MDKIPSVDVPPSHNSVERGCQFAIGQQGFDLFLILLSYFQPRFLHFHVRLSHVSSSYTRFETKFGFFDLFLVDRSALADSSQALVLALLALVICLGGSDRFLR